MKKFPRFNPPDYFWQMYRYGWYLSRYDPKKHWLLNQHAEKVVSLINKDWVNRNQVLIFKARQHRFNIRRRFEFSCGPGQFMGFVIDPETKRLTYFYKPRPRKFVFTKDVNEIIAYFAL